MKPIIQKIRPVPARHPPSRLFSSWAIAVLAASAKQIAIGPQTRPNNSFFQKRILIIHKINGTIVVLLNFLPL